MDAGFEKAFETAAMAEPIIALLVFTVVAVLFVVVKWALPQRAHLKEKQLEIERYRIEVQEKADAALDERERERIKTTQQQIAAQNESSRVIETLATGQQATTRILEVLSSQVGDSKDRSREMGARSEHTDVTVTHMAKQLDEVHAVVVHDWKGGDMDGH